MGRYTKKHEWGSCEFVYKTNFKGKHAGEACSARAMKRSNGKYFCANHKPDRMERIWKRYWQTSFKDIQQRKARLKARLRTLNEKSGTINNSIAVGTEE